MDILKENFLKNVVNDLYKLCFQTTVNISSYKKKQLKSHRSLLDVKRGGAQKQPSEQPYLSNI